ncbi:sirohydrochlorin chelatase [Streptomyces sp. TR06-5]|uniref:sirohydrochlorin chelatase n=1 Tax=unclassified Streptomyces TaxID=2593676 RepID=UPI0039A2CCD0
MPDAYPRLAAPSAAPALVLVAHGSRDPRHAATVASVCRELGTLRPALRVEAAFLEFDTPPVGRVLEALHGEGRREAVAVPLLLSRAFHARTDIPRTLREAVSALPGTEVRQADVLGPDPLLLTALEHRLFGAAPDTEPGRTGVVLAAAGSSDPTALEAVEGLAARWERDAGWAAVRTAYASGDLPGTADAVRGVRATAGVRRVAVVPYVIAPGRLPDRIAAGAREAGADVLAPEIGAAPELVRLLSDRFDEAVTDSAASRAA